MLDRSPPLLLNSKKESSNNNYFVVGTKKESTSSSDTPELISDSEYGISERSSVGSSTNDFSISPVSVRGFKKVSPNFGNLGDSLRAHELQQSSQAKDSVVGGLPSSTNSSDRQQSMAKIYSAIGSLEHNSFSEHTDVRKEIVDCVQKKVLKAPASVTFELNKNETLEEPKVKIPKKESDPKEETSILKTDNKPVKTKKKVKITSEPVEMFRPSCDAYTPRFNQKKNIPYKQLAKREPQAVTTMGSISRPNFTDVLRRVAMIIHQHILKIERRFGVDAIGESKLFLPEMRQAFAEENFATPTYKCTTVRVPMARSGIVYSLQKVKIKYNIPTISEIYDFAHSLFQKVQLSSECSIVCLIYVERLMELAKVPLMADTWRPIFMCGLLLASKVWQDLSSWNIEFSNVYPQYSLDAISRMETQFLKMVKWDLYISSSLYAKYYFALRSLVEKKDFRQRYNQMVGGVGSVDAREAMKVQRRTEMVKEVALSQYSRSM